MSKLFHSLAAQRFVFFTGGGPEGRGAERAAGEGAKSELEIKHEENLKALAEVRDDPEALAAALDNALATTDAMVREKGDTAIVAASQQLDAMLRALGVGGKEAEAIQAQFAKEFKSSWSGDDLKQVELKEANATQEESYKESYKETARTEEQTRYETSLAAIDASIQEAETGVDQWDDEIDAREEALESAQDDVSDAKDGVVDTAETYGLEDLTAEQVMDMNDQTLRAKLFEAKMKEDPTFDAYDPEQQKAFMDAYVAKIQQAIEAVRVAQANEGTAQANLDDAKANKQGWEQAKADRQAERVALNLAYSKTLTSIASGEYRYDWGETINEAAQRTAEAIINSEEQAIIDKYTESAIAKAKELSREVVYKQLEEFKAEEETSRDRISTRIEKRRESLKKNTEKATAAVNKVRKDIGIPPGVHADALIALDGKDGAKRLIVQAVEAKYPEGKARTDLMAMMRAPDEATAIQMRVDQLYTRKFLPAYEAAVAATSAEKTDPVLLAWQSEKRDVEARIARIDSAMAQVMPS